VQGSQSTARSFGVQGRQLLTEGEVFEDEILLGTESADHPAEDMPDRHDHGKNLIGTVRSELFAKSFILWVCDVLARDRQFFHNRASAQVFGSMPMQSLMAG
jgi:hypothetical protein